MTCLCGHLCCKACALPLAADSADVWAVQKPVEQPAEHVNPFACSIDLHHPSEAQLDNESPFGKFHGSLQVLMQDET